MEGTREANQKVIASFCPLVLLSVARDSVARESHPPVRWMSATAATMTARIEAAAQPPKIAEYDVKVLTA